MTLERNLLTAEQLAPSSAMTSVNSVTMMFPASVSLYAMLSSFSVIHEIDNMDIFVQLDGKNLETDENRINFNTKSSAKK